MANQYLDEFEKALETWTDERFVTRVQVRSLAMFSVYIVNFAEAGGWEYSGHSYKPGVPMGCLTVKAYVDDLPVVVFTSGRTHTSCVQTFIRKVETDLLEWRPDRYRE